MRAYTLSVLSQLANTGNPMIEKEIVLWVNTKLSNASKTSSIKSFQDSSISNGKVVLDLIDAIKQGSINYELIQNGDNVEVRNNYLNIFLIVSLNVLFFYFRKKLQMQNMQFQWHVKLELVFMHCLKILQK